MFFIHLFFVYNIFFYVDVTQHGSLKLQFLYWFVFIFFMRIEKNEINDVVYALYSKECFCISSDYSKKNTAIDFSFLLILSIDNY